MNVKKLNEIINNKQFTNFNVKIKLKDKILKYSKTFSIFINHLSAIIFSIKFTFKFIKIF